MTWWDSGKVFDIFDLYKLTVAKENEDAVIIINHFHFYKASIQSNPLNYHSNCEDSWM
jgi:hypothetical protein